MKTLTLLTCFFLFLFLGNPMSQQLRAQVSLQDSLAILDLYASTGGPQWHTQTNWNSPDSSLGSWYGITVDSGRVTKIELENNGLQGALPLSINSLTHLTRLNIAKNQVTGIPAFNGLSELEDLFLSENPISRLPAVDSLLNLKRLWMYNCEVDSLPDFAPCDSLRELIVMNNGTSYLPSLAHNTSLTKIVITGSELSEIPGIEHLVNLEHLIIYGNKFSVVPNINTLKKLRALSIGDNLIQYVPVLDSLKKLEYFSMERNPIISIAPLDSLKKLQTLNCQYTFLAHIPGLGSLTALEKLDCDGCRITQLDGLENCHMLNDLSCELNFLTHMPDLSQAPLNKFRGGYNSLTFSDMAQFASMNFSSYEIDPQRYFLIQADTVGSNLVLYPPFGDADEIDWYHGDTLIQTSDSLVLPLGGAMWTNYRCLAQHHDPFFTGLVLVSYPFDPCKAHLDCDLNGDGRCDLLDLDVIASKHGLSGPAGSCGQFPIPWGTAMTSSRDVSEMDYDFDGIITTLDADLIFRDTFYTLEVQESLTTPEGPKLAAINGQVQEVPNELGLYELSATIIPQDTMPDVKGIVFGELISLPDSFRALAGFHDLSNSVFRDTVDNMLITVLFYFAGDVRLSSGLPSDKARLEVYYSCLNDTAITLYPGDALSVCIITIEDFFLRSNLRGTIFEDSVTMVLQSYGYVLYADGSKDALVSQSDTLSYILNPVLGEKIVLEAKREGEETVLTWNSLPTERGAFHIERGVDAEDMEEIASAEAHAGDMQKYTDRQNLHETVFYRVAWIGENGNQLLSNVAEVRYEGQERGMLSVSPVPLDASRTQLSVRYLAHAEDRIDISLFDGQGRRVYQSRWIGEKGRNTGTLSLSNVSEGLYYLQMAWEGFHRETRPIWILKE